MPSSRRVSDLPPEHLRKVIAEYQDRIGRRSVLFAMRQGSGIFVYYLYRVDDVEAELLGTAEVIGWCVDHGKPIPEELRERASPRDLDRTAYAERLTAAAASTAGNPNVAPESGPDAIDCYVTLDKMAAMVDRSKRTLEKLQTHRHNPLPKPDVEGGGGRPHEWKWSNVRLWLEKTYDRVMPEQFPSDRFRDARAYRS